MLARNMRDLSDKSVSLKVPWGLLVVRNSVKAAESQVQPKPRDEVGMPFAGFSITSPANYDVKKTLLGFCGDKTEAQFALKERTQQDQRSNSRVS